MKFLWRVEYIERLSSSIGMKDYSIDTQKTDYVVTTSDSMFDLERLIELRTSGPQTKLLKFLKAEYLGHPIMEKE